MKIKHMIVFHYPEAYRYEEVEVPCPTWETIEKTIKRLNKDEWPFIWMYKEEYPREDDIPDFEIMGGIGQYVLGGKNPGEDKEQFYTDHTHGSAMIDVWISDQGTSIEASKVCFDLHDVLQMSKYYYEYGELYPDVAWRG